MTTPHESTLHELRSRSAEIDLAIANLDREFAQLASKFDLGDKHALQQADGIEQRIGQLRREKLIIAGREQRLAQEQEDEQTQAAQAEHQARLVQAKQLADSIMALHVEIDRMLVLVREKLAQRAGALQALQRTDLDQVALANRLSHRAVVTRAFCAAGLHKFAELQTVAPNSMVPLASANTVLLGVGRSAAPPPAQNGNANGNSERQEIAPAEGVPRRRLMKGNGGP
jgi:hypothetical protein